MAAVKILASASTGIHAMCQNRERRHDLTTAERWVAWLSVSNHHSAHRHASYKNMLNLEVLQQTPRSK